ACANVANLTLGHIAARRSELTVRAVIGAGRWQLVQQQLVQGLLVSAAGAACALALVVWALPPIVALSQRDGQAAFDVVIAWRLAAFIMVTMIATAIASNVLPTLRAHAASVEG